MGGSEIAHPALEDNLSLEDDLFTSDPLLPEPAADFVASGEMSSMESESPESLDDDWFADDEDDLATSLELPERSELESPPEDILLDSESTSDMATNNALDNWSELVSPTGQPSLDYAPAEAFALPDLTNDDLLEPFSLVEADEISELGLVSEFGSASWEQTAQPIDTLSSGLLDRLTDAEIESELEGLPDVSSLADDFSGNALNEDAEEFSLPSDFGEAASTTGFTLDLPDLALVSEASLDDFGFRILQLRKCL